MAINWQVVAAVLTSVSLLVSGVIGAIVSSMLRRPVDKTNIATMNTEAAVKLMAQWQSAYEKQEKHNREVKEVLRLLICAVDKTVPLLQQLVDSDSEPLVRELRSTLLHARGTLW